MMWARVVEVMLALWLAISPFVFAHGPHSELWWNDYAAAAVLLCLSLASFHPRLRRAHLLVLGLGLWLMGFGYVQDPPTPASQNHIVVGLLLLMVAIVPSEASQPPRVWRTPAD